jgi:leucyl-tRNA synthetase
LERWLQKTIRKVSEKIETFRLNTMVSSLMEFVNILSDRQQSNTWQTATYHRSLEILMVILAPSAPHIADELWLRTGHTGSVHQQTWPTWEPEKASDEFMEVAVQINGKVREVIQAPADASQIEVQEMALASPKVQAYLTGLTIDKTIYIPGKILSVVTRSKAQKSSVD